MGELRSEAVVWASSPFKTRWSAMVAASVGGVPYETSFACIAATRARTSLAASAGCTPADDTAAGAADDGDDEEDGVAQEGKAAGFVAASFVATTFALAAAAPATAAAAPAAAVAAAPAPASSAFRPTTCPNRAWR